MECSLWILEGGAVAEHVSSNLRVKGGWVSSFSCLRMLCGRGETFLLGLVLDLR